jgi:hypothetical protein
VYFKFPVARGEFKKIDHINEFANYGIYRCVIEYKPNKLFKYNKLNYYTHTDIMEARTYNLKIDLIHDEQPNFLYYSRDKLLTGSEVFKDFVHLLFEFKKQNFSKTIKKILNILWGKLCQIDKKEYKIHKDNPSCTIPDDYMIDTILPYDNDEGHHIDCYDTKKIYKYSWARLGPFLLSEGRKKISRIMSPYISDIIRCHTDGLTSRVKLDIKTGDDIGDLKYDYYKNVKIIHFNNSIQYLKEGQ